YVEQDRELIEAGGKRGKAIDHELVRSSRCREPERPRGVGRQGERGGARIKPPPVNNSLI
ncbi:MAG TPA: hypothetical protein VGF60_22485, partial [Xanthobacteraceae bacterium]